MNRKQTKTFQQSKGGLKGGGSSNQPIEYHQQAFSSQREPHISDPSYAKFTDAEDLAKILPAIHFKRHEWRNNVKPVVNDNVCNGVTRKVLETNKEYIEGRWSEQGYLQELHSFQFIAHNTTIYVRKQSFGYLCTLDQEEFIARVQFNLNPDSSDSSLSIIKRYLLRNMSITRIICDQKRTDYDLSVENLMKLIRQRKDSTAVSIDHSEDVFQIFKLASVENIIGNMYISSDLKDAAKSVQSTRKILENRRFTLKLDIPKCDINQALKIALTEIIDKHRDIIYSVYPWKISNTDNHMLDSLPPIKILHLFKQDMLLFTDLCDLVKDPLLLKFIKNTWKKFLTVINQISLKKTLRETAPLTHSSSFFIIKSLQDIIWEITRKSDISVEKLLLETRDGNWNISTANIPWKSSSPLNKSMQQQLDIIFKLTQHYAPGYYTSQKHFKFNFKVLKNCNLDDCTKLIWPYILDSAIEGLLPKDEAGKNVFSPLLKGYTTFAMEPTNYEALRVVTHAIAKYVVQISAHLSDKSLSNDDRKVLDQQIYTINRSIQENIFGPFKDLIEVYNDYWDKRQNIIEKLTSKIPHTKFQQMLEEIKEKLIKIVINAHNKRGSILNIVKFSRSFNDLLTDLNNVDFSWIVKCFNTVDETCLVEMNKSKQSYKVSDLAKFISSFPETVKLPKHYILVVIQELVDIPNNLFLKDWRNDDILDASSELLSAIRKSLIYLNEQADNESFENFKQASVLPFSSTLKNSNSSTEFIKNISTIGELFWFLRKQDEIDIDNALRMYQSLNNGTSTDKLRECYHNYEAEFQRLLHATAEDSCEGKMNKIISELKKNKNSSDLTNIFKWNSKIKYEIIPKLIAGLAAVWSINQSRGLVGQRLKPHCIQIICIFLLLGLDSNNPISNHLAQVLTGQGKSLVLGLLSAVLALTGYKVRMVCHSKYLATRDKNDFEDFFAKLKVNDEISYGTFEELADENLYTTVDGKKTSLRELPIKRFLNHEDKAAGKIVQVNVEKTVLIGDEADVFFTDEFYGNCYGACKTVGFEGLISIQEKIWQIVKENIINKEVIFELTKKFIDESRDTNIIKFLQFYHTPGKYSLLNDDTVITEYTNQTQIDEQLKVMISNAIDVVTGDEHNWYIQKYKLNEKGIICYRKAHGNYSPDTFCNYYNTFNYFRLKKTDFDHKLFKNYGYFIIYCGKVSYAKLPKQYPLILGVSGTLTSLNEHEKRALQQEYNINRLSDMPSFFGRSNLQFNESQLFMCYFRTRLVDKNLFSNLHTGRVRTLSFGLFQNRL